MPGNVSWARRKITRGVRHQADLLRSDGGLRRRDPPVPQDRRREPGHATSIPTSTRTCRTRSRTTTRTGREIWEQTEGRVTHFVTGIGTTGTVMGTGRRLKEYRARHRGLRRRAGRRAARPRGAQAHGELDRAGHLPPRGARRRAADGHRRGVGRRPSGWPRKKGCSSATRRARRWRAALRIASGWSPAGKPGVIVTLFPDRAERYFEAPRDPKMRDEHAEAMSAPVEPRPTPSSPPRRWPRCTRTRAASYPERVLRLRLRPQGRAGRRPRRRLRQHRRTSCTPRIRRRTRATRAPPTTSAPAICSSSAKSLRGDEPGEDHLPLARRRRRLLQRHRSGRRGDGRRAAPTRSSTSSSTSGSDGVGGAAQFAWDAGAAPLRRGRPLPGPDRDAGDR